MTLDEFKKSNPELFEEYQQRFRENAEKYMNDPRVLIIVHELAITQKRLSIAAEAFKKAPHGGLCQGEWKYNTDTEGGIVEVIITLCNCWKSEALKHMQEVEA